MRLSLPARLARLALAAGLALGLVLPAAAPVGAADPLIYRIGTTQEIDSLNPFQAYLYSSYEAFILNYDLLVGFGPDLEYAPTGFAESWTVSPDGKQYTFKIRSGMKWSDGKPATATDVAWTYNYILDSLKTDNPLTLFSLYHVIKVEAPDETTVIATLDAPSSYILGAYIPILPEHVWSKVTPEQANNEFTNPVPVIGTGPFQAVEWQKAQYTRFVRNEHYWGPKPAMDEVQLIYFANQDAMDQALQKGDIDAARSILPNQFKQLDDDPNIVAVNGSTNGFDQMAFNTYDGKGKKGIGGSTSALRDVKFRDALGYAVDKDVLIKQTLFGYGQPGTTVIPPVLSVWHYEPTGTELRKFDLEEAKRRLDAAGYTDKNGDGNREDKDGKEINLNLVTPNTNAYYGQSANLIADWWKQIGIKLTVQVLDKDTVTEYVTPPEAGGKANFDIELWGWGGSPDPDFLLSIFTSEQVGGWSDSFYANPEFDKLYQAQQVAPTQAERKAITDQMQQMIYRDAPYDVLYYSAELHAHRTDKWHGYALQPRKGGTAFFTFGVESYLSLKPGPEPTPTPQAPTASGASPAGGAGTPTPVTPAGSSNSLPLIIGIVALIAVLAIGMIVMRGRRAVRQEEDEE
ncbi:MAG: ABC transporter substrate-binding protein [Chloroflexota bacterium]|nr:ABC transporter substrate-binding protein [Chloroflexota bacterium]